LATIGSLPEIVNEFVFVLIISSDFEKEWIICFQIEKKQKIKGESGS
jgi:hypothetical protein